MKNITKLVAVVAALGVIGSTIQDSYAGGGSSSSSSSSSSSRSSSSSSGSGSGYSKPSSPSSSHSTTPSSTSPSKPSSTTNTAPAPQHQKPTASQPTNSSQGYSKPSTPPPSKDSHTATAPPASSTSTLGAASTRGMSTDSLKAYQAERSTASRPPMPVTKSEAVNNPARSTYKNTDDYMKNRTTVVKNYYNTNPNIGTFNNGMRPNYGMFDSNFLTGMIMGYVGSNLINNSMWMYSHMNEPWYQSYRADLNAQAANNAELKAKVAAMDAEIAKLQTANAAPHAKNVIPKEVDPALAIAPEAMMASEDHHDGMSWWWAVAFFTIGLGAAFIAFKLFK